MLNELAIVVVEDAGTVRLTLTAMPVRGETMLSEIISCYIASKGNGEKSDAKFQGNHQ